MSLIEYKSCYFTFGRFQPCTTGHADNFANLKKIAGINDYRIYISQSVDSKGNNPLPPDVKLEYMKKSLPEHRGKIFSSPTAKDPVSILQELQTLGYDNAYFVVGSDRVSAMQWIKKYNGKDFTFNELDVISSGDRDADGDTFAISGTKMRRAAFAADFKTFRQGIPRALSDADCKKLMDEIRTRLPANFK
jgi:hypothetical protein